jgi:tetratricopeptide (TPR) repeat protein
MIVGRRLSRLVGSAWIGAIGILLLGGGLLLPAPAAYPSRPTYRQASHPLVIIIPGNQQSLSGVASTNQADGETISMRAMRAAIKVRDYLNDSRQLEATLYSPDAPLFARAALEAHLKKSNRYQLTSDEQIALAKAAGAIYVAVIGIQRTSDGSESYDMTLQGWDTESKKSYEDKAKYTIVLPNKTGDANTIHAETSVSPVNAINSAANLLVTRLLNGPLSAYGRVAPTPVLPPTPTESETAATLAANTEADMITATVQQTESLLTDGNTAGAIVLLRHTINQSPLNLQLRLLLARSYLAARQSGEATSEIKRAFTLLTPKEAERKEATAMLAEAFQQTGNGGAARGIYEEIIAAQPKATWARLALADQLQKQEPDAAEEQYRAVLKEEPDNREAAQGLAHLLAQHGDFEAALAAITPLGSNPSAQVRASTAAALFDEFATQVAATLRQNRTAWETKQMSREAFYKATVNQVTQANALVNLLKSTPPTDTDTLIKQRYGHRLLAGALLAQAAAALQTFLETGDKESGAQSSLWLTEFQKELVNAK